MLKDTFWLKFISISIGILPLFKTILVYKTCVLWPIFLSLSGAQPIAHCVAFVMYATLLSS